MTARGEVGLEHGGALLGCGGVARGGRELAYVAADEDALEALERRLGALARIAVVKIARACGTSHRDQVSR